MITKKKRIVFPKDIFSCFIHDTRREVLIYIMIMYYKSRQEEFEDTKGVIRICISKDRQHNGQKKKDKQLSTKHYT